MDGWMDGWTHRAKTKKGSANHKHPTASSSAKTKPPLPFPVMPVIVYPQYKIRHELHVVFVKVLHEPIGTAEGPKAGTRLPQTGPAAGAGV